MDIGIPVRVLLTPAKRTEIFTEDDIDILKEATTSANGNLYYKYKCWVEVNEEETVVDSNVVVLTFYEPAEAPVFTLGNHLRGIGAYINKNYPEVASKFKSGTRMFFYIRTAFSKELGISINELRFKDLQKKLKEAK